MAHYGVSDGPVNVGSFPPNAYGVYDMVGYVGEWVQDWYDPNYYAVSPDRNPKGPKAGLYRVWRGDTWAATDERNLAVSGGFAEVRNDKVIVLADTAERPEEIDRARAERARERAERRLAGRTDEEVDYARALAALARAVVRLMTAGRVG